MLTKSHCLTLQLSSTQNEFWMNEYKVSFTEVITYDFDKNSIQNETKFKTTIRHLLSWKIRSSWTYTFWQRLTISTLKNVTLESPHEEWQSIFGNSVVHNIILDFSDTRGFFQKNIKKYHQKYSGRIILMILYLAISQQRSVFSH